MKQLQQQTIKWIYLKRRLQKFDIEKDKKKKKDTGFKLINTKATGYKQCKNTFPSPQTEHNLSTAIIKFLYCMCISLIIFKNHSKQFIRIKYNKLSLTWLLIKNYVNFQFIECALFWTQKGFWS